MAKSLLRKNALMLRRDGKSINSIASFLGVSKSTASLWCRNIKLEQEQKCDLALSSANGLRRGQLKGALIQKNRRLEKLAMYNKNGVEHFEAISDKEFFVAGLALYLGEGSKKDRRIMFANTNPRIIKFMICWFSKFFDITKDDFNLTVMINEIHRKRDWVIKKFWSDYLNFPIQQFRNTIFTKSLQKKVYENYDSYYGTFRLRILKSTNLSYKIGGLNEGLIRSVVK